MAHHVPPHVPQTETERNSKSPIFSLWGWITKRRLGGDGVVSQEIFVGNAFAFMSDPSSFHPRSSSSVNANVYIPTSPIQRQSTHPASPQKRSRSSFLRNMVSEQNRTNDSVLMQALMAGLEGKIGVNGIDAERDRDRDNRLEKTVTHDASSSLGRSFHRHRNQNVNTSTTSHSSSTPPTPKPKKINWKSPERTRYSSLTRSLRSSMNKREGDEEGISSDVVVAHGDTGDEEPVYESDEHEQGAERHVPLEPEAGNNGVKLTRPSKTSSPIVPLTLPTLPTLPQLPTFSPPTSEMPAIDTSFFIPPSPPSTHRNVRTRAISGVLWLSKSRTSLEFATAEGEDRRRRVVSLDGRYRTGITGDSGRGKRDSNSSGDAGATTEQDFKQSLMLRRIPSSSSRHQVSVPSFSNRKMELKSRSTGRTRRTSLDSDVTMMESDEREWMEREREGKWKDMKSEAPSVWVIPPDDDESEPFRLHSSTTSQGTIESFGCGHSYGFPPPLMRVPASTIEAGGVGGWGESPLEDVALQQLRGIRELEESSEHGTDGRIEILETLETLVENFPATPRPPIISIEGPAESPTASPSELPDNAPVSKLRKRASSLWRQSITLSALTSTSTTTTTTIIPSAIASADKVIPATTEAERRRHRLTSDPINAYFALPPPIFSRPNGSHAREPRPVQYRRKGVIMPERPEEVLRRRRASSMGLALERRMSIESQHSIVLDLANRTEGTVIQSFICSGNQEEGEKLPAIRMDIVATHIDSSTPQDDNAFTSPATNTGGEGVPSVQPLEDLPIHPVVLESDHIPLAQSLKTNSKLPHTGRLTFPTETTPTSAASSAESARVPTRQESFFQRALMARRRMVSTGANDHSLKHKKSMPSLREASRASNVDAHPGSPMPKDPGHPQSLRKRFSLSNLSMAFKRKDSKADLRTAFANGSEVVPAVPVLPPQYRSVTQPVPLPRSSSDSTMSPARTSSVFALGEGSEPPASKLSDADDPTASASANSLKSSILTRTDAQTAEAREGTSSTASSVTAQGDAQAMQDAYRQDSWSSPETSSEVIPLRVGSSKSWRKAFSSSNLSLTASPDTPSGTSDEDEVSSTCSFTPTTPDTLQGLSMSSNLAMEEGYSSSTSTLRKPRERRETESIVDDTNLATSVSTGIDGTGHYSVRGLTVFYDETWSNPHPHEALPEPSY